MANRFDNPQPQRYVSTYVPDQFIGKPLDALTNLAKDYSDKYKTASADISNAKDEILKVNAIDKHQGHKKMLLEQYNSKLDELAEQWLKNPTDYSNKLKLDNLIKDYRNNDLRNELETSYHYYNEDLKSLRKLSEDRKYGYWNDNITKFNKSYKDGELIPYRSTGVKSATNHLEGAKKAMGKIASDGYDIEKTVVGNDGITRGFKNGLEVISSDKVMQEAYNKADGFIDSPEGQDFVEKLKYDYPNATQQDIYKGVINLLYTSASEQIFNKPKSGSSEEVNRAWNTLHDEKNKLNSLYGTPLESKTLDLTADNKEYHEAKDSGLIKETKNADGSIKLNVDWKKISEKEPVYDVVDVNGRKVSTVVGYKDSKQKALQLGKVVGDIAKSIGYEGEVNHKNFDDILNRYNAFAKTRVADEQMSAPVSKVETEKLKRNWNNYDLMDPEKPDQPLSDKPVLEEGDEVVLNNFRHTPKGNMNRDGYIKKKDGTIEPIMVRPRAIIDDGFHNKIASQSLKGTSWEAGLVKGTKDPKNKDVEVIDNLSIPDVGTLETFGLIDPLTKQKKSGYLLTPKDGSKPLYFTTQADMIIHMNQKYYSTKVGNTDLYNIAPDSKSLKDLQK
jgi:hypothetical protein